MAQQTVCDKMRKRLFTDHEFGPNTMIKQEISDKGAIDNILQAKEIETEIQLLEAWKPVIFSSHRKIVTQRIASLKRSLKVYAKMVPLIFFLCFLFACSSPEKDYKFAIEYFNGQKDTITWTGTGENYFYLHGGDFICFPGNEDKPLISGVRSFHTISIIQKAVNVPIHNN